MDTNIVTPAEVGDIFRLYGEQFRQCYNLTSRHIRAMNAIKNCRTRALGSHSDTCDQCGYVRVYYNSCRNRHCPKCQGLNQTKWVDKRIPTATSIFFSGMIVPTFAGKKL